MSGFSSQGVGAAACANADVASTLRAAAINRIFVEKVSVVRLLVEVFVMIILPTMTFLNKSRTSSLRQYNLPSQAAFTTCLGPHTRAIRLCDFPYPASRLSSPFGLEQGPTRLSHRDDSDEPRH